MSRTFRDHFSAAAGYARYRPRYPPELFAFLADRAPDRRLAWDCATGSGQAAVELATHFDQVIATDASVAQLARAQRRSPARFAAALADAVPLPSTSVDLVTVAQALHWLDLDDFYREVRRVAKASAVIAVWTYPLLSAGEDVDSILYGFAYETVGPWWPAGSRHVRNRYRDLDFPFQAIEVPLFMPTADWSLEHLAGYVGTWSAMHRYRADTGEDPLPELVAELAPLWGASRTVRWNLRVLAGRVGE